MKTRSPVPRWLDLFFKHALGFFFWALIGNVVVADEPAFGFNLLSNGGFEGDWFNTRAEIMSCPVETRSAFGQADGIPDGWNVTECRRVADAHSGYYAVQIPAGKTASQDQIGYVVVLKGAPRAVPLRFSAWVKGGAGRLTVLLAGATKETGDVFNKSQDFAAATDWTRVALDIPAAEIEAALKANEKAVGAIMASATIAATGAATTIDDVRLERPYSPSPYTLIPNPGFEQAGSDGAPSEWSAVRKSLRHTGATWYYIWRSWYHFMGVPRGANGVDDLVVAAGKRSFRMNVPPGDEKYIESAAVALNQTAPTRMALRFDYNAFMLADLVVRVMDEQGNEVFFDHLAPGTTSGWHAYQRDFVPLPIQPKETSGGTGTASKTGEPVALKSCRVRIGVRGVNGSNHDDINQWINVNHAGVLWFDNVALMEVENTSDQVRTRGVKVYDIESTHPDLLVESVDLGERLYGENATTVTLVNLGRGDITGALKMTVSGPCREDDSQKAGYAMGAPDQAKLISAPPQQPDQAPSAKFTVKPGQRTTLVLPYNIRELTEDWRSEYRVKLSLDDRQTTHLTFGTWSQQALVEVLRCYSFPEETDQLVSMNLGVARPTLQNTRSVRVEIRRASDHQTVETLEIADFPKIMAGFNLAQLPKPPDPTGKNPPDRLNYGWQGDASNFHQITLNIGQLPVHPQTRPVRDHYVHVKGTDASGKTVFEGDSPRFGRMEAHAEKLDPIQKVEIAKEGWLLINGKPFFNRGHLQMQQNFGPSVFSHANMDFKKTGFNTAGCGQVASEKGLPLEAIWATQNLYSVTHTIKDRPPMTPDAKAEIEKLVSHPGVIGVNYVSWEGTPAGGTNEERLNYVKEIKAAAKGHPLWLSAGWYSPTISGPIYPDYIEHDMFAPENNSYFQPSQLDKEVLAKKRQRGETAVLGTFPNVFNDMPWEVERFEHWTEIIRHHTGYTLIGIPGDPTLLRGMNGEIRFIESFLFSKDPPPETTVSPDVEHIVRSANGRTYILASNAGPVIGGDWKWNSEIKDQGVASHTGDALWNRFHPFMKDYHSHFYKDDQPVTVKKGDKIAQYVMIPRDAKVDALALMVRGNGDWMYHALWGNWNHQEFTDSAVRMWLGKEMHQMFWGTMGWCGPEGGDPKNANLLKFVFTEPQFHKMGALPEAGKWARLEAPVETLGLDGQVVDGFGYLTKGANVWWERTLLAQDGKEKVLCDGSVGIRPDKLKSVRFNVAGLKAGTKVKVMFDERDIAAKDGYFEDDLSGKPGYQNLWVGIYGDKIGETGYYGDGIFYNYNWGRVAARFYEIPR
ncbi:MAG: hypothetical protein HY360_06495 [Verrucomicrobia bacterium]|nr:hypothetical protein [Verrucomicrobiota bacterium]